jgi:hypothetical protein
MDHLLFKDDSSDRKFFTMIPNFILDTMTGIEQSIYINMKRMAGSSDVCYASQKTLTDLVDISKGTLKKYLKSLIDQKVIEEAGFHTLRTRGGPQTVTAYRICNVWKRNTDFYEGGSKKDTPFKGGSKSGQRGVKTGIKGGSNPAANNIPPKEDIEKDGLFSISKGIPEDIKAEIQELKKKLGGG